MDAKQKIEAALADWPWQAVKHDDIRELLQTLASKEAELVRLRARLIAYADSEYCKSLQMFRRTECLGWEAKVKTGKYTEVEHEAHRKANEAMGAHRGIYAVLKLFDAERAALTPQPTE